MAGLLKARVPRATAERLVQNRMYTPADLLILSKALTSLKAQNTALFVARAAGAATREEAMFRRGPSCSPATPSCWVSAPSSMSPAFP